MQTTYEAKCGINDRKIVCTVYTEKAAIWLEGQIKTYATWPEKVTRPFPSNVIFEVKGNCDFDETLSWFQKKSRCPID